MNFRQYAANNVQSMGVAIDHDRRTITWDKDIARLFAKMAPAHGHRLSDDEKDIDGVRMALQVLTMAYAAHLEAIKACRPRDAGQDDV